MNELQDRLARVGLDVLAEYGFALAGGYALQAHQLVDRMSEDVDMFTDQFDANDFNLHGRGTVTLPGSYVQEHVALAYAVTVHRSQGLTVDQAVLVVDRATSAEHLYVGMTRGRRHNLACVVTEPAGDEHTRRRAPTPGEVLTNALRRTSAEKSATETLRDDWNSYNPGPGTRPGLRSSKASAKPKITATNTPSGGRRSAKRTRSPTTAPPPTCPVAGPNCEPAPTRSGVTICAGRPSGRRAPS